MNTGISSSDFVDQWSLSFADIDFINSKLAATRLGLAAQLKFFSARGFFADDGTLIPTDAAEYLAEQIGVRAEELSSYDFGGRTARRHCAEILRYLGFGLASEKWRGFLELKGNHYDEESTLYERFRA